MAMAAPAIASFAEPHLTKKELLDLGKQQGVKVTTRMKKAQLETMVLGEGSGVEEEQDESSAGDTPSDDATE